MLMHNIGSGAATTPQINWSVIYLHSTATSAPGQATFGPGTGAIVLDQVSCSGSEASIFDCPHGGLNIHDCSHFEDAGVICAGS